MYKIIGSDNLEYGPVSSEVIRQWIAEGRLNAQSRVRPEGTLNWLQLQVIPEFAADLGLQPAQPAPPAGPAPIPAYTPAYTPAYVPEVRNNQFAIWGFVCSVASVVLCCCGLLAIPGLIMSCIALGQIRRNPAQGGRGFAIAGIIIASIALVWAIISGIIFFVNPQGFQGFQQLLKNS